MIFQYDCQNIRNAKIKNDFNIGSSPSSIDTKKLHYELYLTPNSTTTIVFLHGWGGNYQSFLPIYSAFNDFNILSIDFCGFGESDKPNANFTIFSYADVVKKLLGHLKLTKIILVGHSFGGRVAQILAVECKQIVDKIILIDSAGIKSRFSVKKVVRVLRYKFNKKLVNWHMKKAEILKKFGSLDYQKLSDEEKIVFTKIVNQDLGEYAKKIKQQTLIVWGEKDKDTPLYMAKKLHKYIKNSKLYVVKGAGHFSYLDNSQIVINIIKEFLK